MENLYNNCTVYADGVCRRWMHDGADIFLSAFLILLVPQQMAVCVYLMLINSHTLAPVLPSSHLECM